MKIYAVEILSVTLGLWLSWIIIIYSNYIHNLRKKNAKESIEVQSEGALLEGKTKRKRAYTIAVTFPSYFIFWIIVIIWGISYLTEKS